MRTFIGSWIPRGWLPALLLIAFPTPHLAGESVDSLNPLFAALPAARFVAVDGWERIRDPAIPLSRVSGLFLGIAADGSVAGSVVHVLSPGYGGDIALLAAFDPKGTLLRVNVVRHAETRCHVEALEDGSFLRRFEGLAPGDRIRLVVGAPGGAKGDIDAMSGGTVTSKAVSEGVAEARIAWFLADDARMLKLP